MKPLLAIAGAATLMLASMTQTAMPAEARITGGGANLRAGPGFEYRVILSIPPGNSVNVQNCVRNGSWCRINVFGCRGWVAVSRLKYRHTGRPGGGNPVGVDPDGKSTKEYVKILGVVVDRPGYCYALDHAGNSIIVKCP
jgi:uncharacterized protein YraI